MVGSKIGKINSPRPITLNAECVLEVGVGLGGGLGGWAVSVSSVWAQARRATCCFPGNLANVGMVIASLQALTTAERPARPSQHWRDICLSP